MFESRLQIHGRPDFADYERTGIGTGSGVIAAGRVAVISVLPRIVTVEFEITPFPFVARLKVEETFDPLELIAIRIFLNLERGRMMSLRVACDANAIPVAICPDISVDASAGIKSMLSLVRHASLSRLGTASQQAAPPPPPSPAPARRPAKAGT